MLKLGVIGLGDIAQKAYLPLYASLGAVEWHLYTRNQEKLQQLSRQYNLPHMHDSLESLLGSGVTGALVHGATTAHATLIGHLLEHGLHVFVDKPITLDYTSTRQLTEQARARNLILMAGFNRRYAPAYQRLKQVEQPNMVLMQKNRAAQPAPVRTFIFDDFIHVVDTLLYLFPYPITEVRVSGRVEGELLYHVTVQLISSSATAIGIMNRDSGTSEERLEVMSATEKRIALQVSDVLIRKGGDETRLANSDWEPLLQKRGFEPMLKAFIEAVQTGKAPEAWMDEALRTHELCERIVEELLRQG